MLVDCRGVVGANVQSPALVMHAARTGDRGRGVCCTACVYSDRGVSPHPTTEVRVNHDGLQVIAALLHRPAQRELMTCELWQDLVHDLSKPMLKGDTSITGLVMAGIQGFITAVTHKGTARSGDDAALQAVAAAICGTTGDMAGKKAAFQRFFKLSNRRIAQAIKLNDSMPDGATHFEKVPREQYAGCVVLKSRALCGCGGVKGMRGGECF